MTALALSISMMAEEARHSRGNVEGTMKLHRIGEVASQSNLSRQAIHLYTAMGLIKESQTTPAGYRLYDESVFRRLKLIRKLNQRGYSLREIKRIFFKERA